MKGENKAKQRHTEGLVEMRQRGAELEKAEAKRAEEQHER